MSKIRNNDWKLVCRSKLAEELNRSEKALRSYIDDENLRYFIVRKARRVCAAIERFELGIFGQCIKCERQISRKRLLAYPLAEFCVNCQVKQKGHNHSLSPVTPVSKVYYE
jgi:RNA polymerase-binding transcription factor DksA